MSKKSKETAQIALRPAGWGVADELEIIISAQSDGVGIFGRDGHYVQWPQISLTAEEADRRAAEAMRDAVERRP